MSGDFQLEDTIYIPFTTRAFATGIPTVLAGTPVVTGHRDANLTQFTTGITLAVDFDDIVGLNMITIVATAANAYAAGETYTLYLSAGTVSSVSVVGEVVGHFTLDASSASKVIGAAGAGLTALSTQASVNTIDTEVGVIDGIVDELKTAIITNAVGADVTADVATAQADLDTLTGSDGATLATTQGNYAPAKAGDSMDVLSISGDATAADNLELMYDGTGYTDETAPASRQQVDNIGAASGAALNYEASADNTAGAIIDGVTIVGSITANLFTDTDVEDAIRHQLTHAANAFDFVYRLPVGGNRTGATVEWRGFLTSSNDTCSMQAYDHVSAWDTVATITGTNGTTNGNVIASLLSKHTGTGAELGNVYIRFVTTGQTSPVLNTDLLLVQAVNIGQSVGYANGSIWIDTNNGVAGTESFVNGVADNPVDLLASAKTISTSVGIGDFHVINGSSITLAEDSTNESYFGDNWTIALGGQTVTGAHFEGATVSGTHVGACEFLRCEVGTMTTVAETHYENCGMNGTVTLPVGNVFIDNAHHEGSFVLEFGGAVGSTTVHCHKYAGEIILDNFGDSGTDILHLDGQGKLTINASSTGGTVNLRGNWQIANAASGVTINYDDQSGGYESGAIWIDTSASNTGTNAFVDGTVENPVSTIGAAVSLKTAIGIPDFHLFNGSSITLAASAANNSFFGDHWTLALGGQACGGIYVEGATVTGIGTSAGEEMHFEGCDIGTATVEQGHFDKCGFTGTLTLNTADDYEFHNCYDKSATAAIFTKTASVNITAEWVNWSGDITVSGVQASSTYLLAGTELGDIILNGADGTVEVRGIYKTITDNRTGSPTLTITGAIKAADIASILVDTAEIGTAGAGLTDLGGTLTELAAVPADDVNILKMVGWLYLKARNKITQTATTQLVLADDGSTTVGTSTVSDDTTTATRGEYV